jgi:hypothetical protein
MFPYGHTQYFLQGGYSALAWWPRADTTISYPRQACKAMKTRTAKQPIGS